MSDAEAVEPAPRTTAQETPATAAQPEPSAESVVPDSPEPQEQVTREQVRVRRTPRYWRFVFLGAAVFGIAATVVTYSVPYDPATATYDRNAAFGILLAFSVALGMAVGIAVSLIAERVTRRGRTLAAEHITVADRPAAPQDGDEPA